jgi:poly-gamma-glutamate synthesis protein (capsule biosynthesis protein)
MRRNIDEIEKEKILTDERPESTTKQKIKMIIWLIVLIFIYYQIYNLVMYTIGKKDKEKMWLYNSLNSVIGTFVTKTSTQTTENHSLKFAGLGDVYATANTIKGAKTSSSYDFTNGTESIAIKLKEYDLVMASLNTPVAESELGYTSSNKYNTPIEMLDTLKNMNVSVVATATYHIIDKSEKGITQTLESLKDKKISQIGISGKTRNDPLVITKNDITLGILSYTTDTSNEISSSKDYLVNVLDEKDLKKDVEYLKSKNVDYIIAYLNVYDKAGGGITSSDQKEKVELLFNNGVNVVLGTGSAIVQDKEEDQIDLNNEKSHVYTIYSLGDILGGCETDDSQTSVIANIEFTKTITKNKKGESTNTEKDMLVKTPIGVWTKITTAYKKEMYLIDDEIQAYSNNKSELTAKEYTKIKTAYEKIKQLYE